MEGSEKGGKRSDECKVVSYVDGRYDTFAVASTAPAQPPYLVVFIRYTTPYRTYDECSHWVHRP